VANSAGSGDIPLFFAFYDQSVVTTCLKILGFLALPPGALLRDLALYVKGKLGLGYFDNLDAYHVEKSLQAIQLAPDTSLATLPTPNGLVVFQTDGAVTSKEWTRQKLYRTIDFIPELYCPTVAAFFEFIRSATAITVSDGAGLILRLVASNLTPMSDVLVTVRHILQTPETDGILVLPRDQATHRPLLEPIKVTRSPVSKVLANPFIFCRTMPGISQEELAKRVLFKLRVADATLSSVTAPFLLMQPNFTGQDVIGKLIDKRMVNTDAQIRLVELNGSRLLRIVNQQTELAVNGSYRAEEIPEDQQDVPESELVRVTLTKDRKSPGSAPVGNPFFFRVVPGELFSATKARLAALAHLEGNVAYGYTNACTSYVNFAFLKDEHVLSELLDGRNKMIYVFLSSELKANNDGSLRIYN
jgi:hypothetical protein